VVLDYGQLKTWKEVTQLTGHELSVTQIEFSHTDKDILSVSRKCAIIVYTKQEDGNYLLYKKILKAHERIIWGCCWSLDDKIFATGSRDKTVKIWYRSEKELWETKNTITFTSGITAVAFAPINGYYLLAVGTEDGEIYLYDCPAAGIDYMILRFNDRDSHINNVRRLCWRIIDSKNNIFELASCSYDHSFRIFTIKFDIRTVSLFYDL